MIDNFDLADGFQNMLDEHGLDCTEGPKGFSNLCKLANLLGHKDPMSFGNLSRGGNLGDLMVFFEDNPGAIQAVYDWIEDHGNSFEIIQDYVDELE